MIYQRHAATKEIRDSSRRLKVRRRGDIVDRINIRPEVLLWDASRRLDGQDIFRRKRSPFVQPAPNGSLRDVEQSCGRRLRTDARYCLSQRLKGGRSNVHNSCLKDKL